MSSIGAGSAGSSGSSEGVTGSGSSAGGVSVAGGDVGSVGMVGSTRQPLSNTENARVSEMTVNMIVNFFIEDSLVWL